MITPEFTKSNQIKDLQWHGEISHDEYGHLTLGIPFLGTQPPLTPTKWCGHNTDTSMGTCLAGNPWEAEADFRQAFETNLATAPLTKGKNQKNLLNH